MSRPEQSHEHHDPSDLTAASTHDRGHADAQAHAQEAEQLHPCGPAFRRVPRPLAGHGQRRGSAPLSAELRTVSTSVCWRSPGHSTLSAVTERIRLTVGLALRARLRRLRNRPAIPVGRGGRWTRGRARPGKANCGQRHNMGISSHITDLRNRVRSGFASAEEFDKAKGQALERVRGPMHGYVAHAIVPYEIGGPVDMYYFPQADGPRRPAQLPPPVARSKSSG
jgi:hypothetical protein